MSDSETDVKHRVKVFSFSDNIHVWEDMGTGYVSKDYIEVTRGEMFTITVRSEYDDSIIIQSKVEPEKSYKLNSGTMIIWTENSSCDIALSFQEKAGCDALWAKICEVQNFMSEEGDLSVSEEGDLSDRLDDSWGISENYSLPPCELSKLDEILSLINTMAPFPKTRLGLCIEREGYIAKLLDLFHICEDLENLDGLHRLYEIFKALFMFNSASLLQIMFQEDTMNDVIGCLEYNPARPEPTRHRDYLAKTSTHKEVIQFTNPEILPKIHQTYRIQYIQEVILPTPSLFEENMMSVLNSFILFNKTEIIKMIQEDSRFLKQLFTELCDDSTPDSKYQELVSLIKEVCMFSLALESNDRSSFFLKLSGFGFMSAIEGMLVYEDLAVISSAVDILNLIAEFNSSILRDYIIQTKESVNEDNQFLNIIISLLVDGECAEVDVQLVGLIKALINPENMTVEAAAKTEAKAIFLKYFYDHCMPRLMAPLMAQTSSDTISKDTPQNAVLLSHILDILSLCVRVHSYHIRNYIIDKNVLSRVLVLMISCHGHLVLAALRFCRWIIGLKDEFYNRYIIYKNLLSPIVKAFMRNGKRYNLINSAILELFEYIRKEKIKSLTNYIVENFMSTLEVVDYVTVFKELKLLHEQKDTSWAEGDLGAAGKIVVQTRYKRDPRQMDEEEEAWFDEEEDELINVKFSPPPRLPPQYSTIAMSTPVSITIPTATTTTTMSLSTTTATPTFSSFVRISSVRSTSSFPSSTATTTTSPVTFSGYSPRPATTISRTQQPQDGKVACTPTISSALQSLVDYDEDSDEETTSAEETNSSNSCNTDGEETNSSNSCNTDGEETNNSNSCNTDGEGDGEEGPRSAKRQKLT